MKVQAKYIKHLFNNKGQAELNLLIPNIYHTALLKELDTEKEYNITITEKKSSRSMQQNKYMWALLGELEKASSEDIMDWYTNALEEANAKSEYIVAVDGIEQSLLKVYRGVRKIGKRFVDGKEVMGYRCYYGSSKFTTEEMNKLLEIILCYCAEYDIQTERSLYE